ncbi:MAG TPA: hypothetical protein VN924_08765 [Bryobacteraceae bacterium]|nr:hypothetical protein [Bryobacteraceae bacterium]
MATINQIHANRLNAQKSTGPKTPEGKDKVRFNSLVHGLRAESPVIPGEDQGKFDRHLERLIATWTPSDDREQSLVEQIAVTQWKLARIDHAEAKIYAEGAMTPVELSMAINRLCLTQVRLERSISSITAELDRYRKSRLEPEAEAKPTHKPTHKPATDCETSEQYQKGLVWSCPEGRSYTVLPKVCGLDGVWREIPREVLGDFSNPPPG